MAAPAGDVRVVHTCSVTTEAAVKSRQTVRRATRLPVLGQREETVPGIDAGDAKVIVTGCWAESDRAAAEALPGVAAVLGHTDDIQSRLTNLLNDWLPKTAATAVSSGRGMMSLPQLGERQATHQRAFLKVQDGCDAHCTYCIIPQLRPTLWSKTAADAVEEAQALVNAGHREIVLTGIFLGAFGQPTALRRRQPAGEKPLQSLVRALCTKVNGLARLRLSSMEPGDLDDALIAEFKQHPQIVPHFHLPLQSGSDAVLRKMNRQYGRGQFIDMVDALRDAFDRPALTTDIIAGFPGETDESFEETVAVVDHAKFLHIHAFPYSRRPNTAAARWTGKAIPTAVTDARMDTLRQHRQSIRKRIRRRFYWRNGRGARRALQARPAAARAVRAVF
ncbi:MAG: MiaB/RimO family radical SAM methylthiotransferase [Tepidisphaeraceae bacterium]